MSLRVLIIEDIEERQKILTSLYRSHAWILVNTGHRAIALLNSYEFDLISLDYNLAGELNGADVAKVISDRNKNTRVIVHSLNSRGCDRILQILPAAIPYPISKIVRSNQAFKRLRANIDRLGTTFDWYHQEQAKL
jgi:CheY-like chemotaxis protein